KAWVVGWLVRLCKCVQCVLAEIFKNAKRGYFLFSTLSVVLFFILLHCWSSRVSPCVKAVCVVICLSLLVIVNVYGVFFSMCPNGSRLCVRAGLEAQTFNLAPKLIKSTNVQ